MIDDATFDTLKHSVMHNDETRLLEGLRSKRKEKSSNLRFSQSNLILNQTPSLFNDSYKKEPSYQSKYFDRPPFDPSNVNKSMDIINRSEARIRDLKKKIG